MISGGSSGSDIDIKRAGGANDDDKQSNTIM